MKKIYFLFALVLSALSAKTQTVQVTANPGTSGNIVIGGSNYHVIEGIYQEAEIGGATAFTTNAITKIAFNCNTISTVDNTVTSPNFKIYLKNVSAATTTLATGAYSTAGYTLVYSGAYTFSATGWNEVILTTTFTRTTGSNLQLLIERTDNVLHTGNIFLSANGNTGGATLTTSRRYNSTVAPVSGTSSLTASAFRPALQLYAPIPNDAQVLFASLPFTTCHTTNQSYTVQLKNVGVNSIAPGAASVQLRVRGANTYTASLTNATSLATNATENITFTGININNTGNNLDTAIVTFAGDPNTTNDTAKSSNTTSEVLSTYPLVETADISPLPVFGFIQTVTGDRNLWGLRSTPYTNADQTAALNPHSGTTFYLFDAYSGASSVGFISRLFTKCIQVPSGVCSYGMNFWMSHDNTSALPELDSMYVSVSTDKGVTWTRVNIDGVAGVQRADATLTSNAAPIWRQHFVNLLAYEGQTIQIAMEGVSKYGNAIGIDDITIDKSASQIALNTGANNAVNLVAACTATNDWTYYNDPADANKTYIAIQWDPANAGANVAAKAAATPTVQLDAAYFASEDVGAKKATYTMKRYWNVNLNASTMTAPVNVRFFYAPADKTEIETAATNFAAANGAVVEGGLWFKTDGVPFAPSASTVTPDYVLNSFSLSDNIVNGTANGLTYGQLNGITTFSGGTFATGVGVNTPLPVQVTNLRAAITDATNTVTWTTVTESNNDKFIIERSVNGNAFTTIGTVSSRATNGTSVTPINYNFVDVNPVQGKQYYRLQLVDRNGRTSYSQIVTVRRGAGKLEIVDVRPNPTTGMVNFNVLGVGNNVAIAVRNLQGQTLLSKNLVQANGFSVDLAGFVNGIYILEAVDVKTGDKAVYKIVKQ